MTTNNTSKTNATNNKNSANTSNDCYLCGGVLFFLIASIVLAPRPSKNSKYRLKDLMKDWLKASFYHDGEYEGFSKDISEFKECKTNGSRGLCFGNSGYEYVRSVEGDYQSALNRMTKFAEKYFGADKSDSAETDIKRKEAQIKRKKAQCITLVLALLKIIENDSNIDDNPVFFIGGMDKPIVKSELIKEKEFCLPSFLLGVWYYICKYRSKYNTQGQSTLDLIGKKDGRSTRIFRDEFLLDYDKKIDVHIIPESGLSSDNLEDDQTDDNLKDHISESKAHDQSEQSDQSGQETPTEEVRSSITNIQGNVIINNGYVNSVPVPTPIVVLETKRARALCGSKYFHFIVTNEDGIFEKEWLKMSSSRLISQYTVPAAIQEYCLPLNNETVSNLIELPAIICQENNGSSNLQNQDQKCVLARIERIKIKNIGDVTISFKTILEFNQSLLYDKNAAADLGLEDDPFLTCLRSTQWSIFEGDLSSAFDKLGVVFPDDESSTQLDAQQ